MKDKTIPRPEDKSQNPSSPLEGKKKWQEPKLAFIEPKLTKHGKLTELTQFNGFFGQFSP